MSVILEAYIRRKRETKEEQRGGEEGREDKEPGSTEHLQ